MRSIERWKLVELWMRPTSSAFGRALISLGLAGGLVGCGTIEPVSPADPPITDPTQLYRQLTLNYPAVNLSTAPGYNTVQLRATPRDAQGNPMVGPSVLTFRTLDTTKVLLRADGLVTALETTNAVDVIAELTMGPVTHVDTARIQVTSLTEPPQLASLSIHPVAPDSAIWTTQRASATSGQYASHFFAFAGYYSPGTIQGPKLIPKAVNLAGDTLTDLLVDYVSLNPLIATVNRQTGDVKTVKPGQVTMIAETMAYGVAKADTMTFTVTQQAVDEVDIQPGPTGAVGFVAQDIIIRPFGIVFWRNLHTDPIDVTFDDSTNVMAVPSQLCAVFLWEFGGLSSLCGTSGSALLPGDDLDVYPIGVFTARQFPVPGVYLYHSTRLGGISGQIIVTANPTDS